MNRLLRTCLNDLNHHRFHVILLDFVVTLRAYNSLVEGAGVPGPPVFQAFVQGPLVRDRAFANAGIAVDDALTSVVALVSLSVMSALDVPHARAGDASNLIVFPR
jgi:hypothetical protein